MRHFDNPTEERITKLIRALEDYKYWQPRAETDADRRRLAAAKEQVVLQRHAMSKEVLNEAEERFVRHHGHLPMV